RSLLQQLPEVHGSKFYYFGFGSNMLEKRIHIQNPSAKFLGAAVLNDYRVDFALQSHFWEGAVATIVRTPGAHTWGALWELELHTLPDLDNQEGVSHGVYQPINVPVHSLLDKQTIECRVYHLCDQPKTDVHGPNSVEEATAFRLPSKTYLKVIVKGAEETGLPPEYIQWLKAIRHNGNSVQDMESKLELSEVKLT
ncbi:hypothetical protein KR093_008805, partial [Drosophila rubida]